MFPKFLITLAILTVSSLVYADLAQTNVPMHFKKTSTLYVEGMIKGVGPTEFLVDTGASYLALNEATMNILDKNGQAVFVRELSGIMADGRKRLVPIYRVAKIKIGDHCTFHDVEAAVVQGNTRNILGLSALRKAAPFTFSMDPPVLGLSHCS